jgi:hypothetical protein
VQLVVQSQRPDVLVHRVEGGMQDARSAALLAWARAEAQPVTVATFMKRMHTRTERVERPQLWFGTAAPGPSMDLVSLWTVSP